MEEFCRKLPKVELHAHLNGSVSRKTIAALIESRHASDPSFKGISTADEAVISKSSLPMNDVFRMFPLIHSLTDNEASLRQVCRRRRSTASDRPLGFRATAAVVADFHADGVVYLELRTRPRHTRAMSARQAAAAVLAGVADCAHLAIAVRLLLSVDRRGSLEDALRTVRLAAELSGAPDALVVGVDLSGDPAVDARPLLPALRLAKDSGLRLALHMAETRDSSIDELPSLMALQPDRIGHGTYLDTALGGSTTESVVAEILQRRIPIELCLTSNFKCETRSFDDHHMGFWLLHDHPTAISTDDKGIFDTNLSTEYLIAARTFNLTEDRLYSLARDTLNYAFIPDSLKQSLRRLHWQ